MSHTEFLTGTEVYVHSADDPQTLTENPSVRKILDTTGQVYNVAKNHNGLTRWSLEKLENPVNYIANQTNERFGPTLKRIDEYAGATVDRAGQLYEKADISRRVIEPVSKVSGNLLTSAERAVDSYLPEKKPSPRQPRNGSTSNSRRAINLSYTVYDRVKERLYSFYLLLASITLFLIAEFILFFIEAVRAATLFSLTTSFRFIRAPRETALDLFQRGQQLVLRGIYLALHPIELFCLILERFISVQKRINRNLADPNASEGQSQQDDSGLRKRKNRGVQDRQS